jgi:hypothetical protein
MTEIVKDSYWVEDKKSDVTISVQDSACVILKASV